MCEESLVNLVLCEPTDSNCSTPGFTPGFAPDSRSCLILLNHSVGSRKRWFDRGIALSHSIIIQRTFLRLFF